MSHDENPDVAHMGEQDHRSSLADKEVRTWAMIIHLSVFTGYIVPLAGLIAPIIIWQIKKEKLPGVDIHGRIITNYLISMIIYSAITLVLCFVIVGFALLPVLGVVAIVFPIIGGIKANDGIAWHYPLMIKFF